MRRQLLALIALLVVFLLSSCTVPVAGLAGIGVDAEGNLVGYLRVCHGRLDGATLYHDDPERGEFSASIDVGSWRVQPGVDRASEWSLTDPSGGWSASKSLEPPLSRGHLYTLYGWTLDNTLSAGGVSFTLDDVTEIVRGEIAVERQTKLRQLQ